MSQPINHLLKLLDLETLERNLFRGQSRNDGFPQVFGGQVIAQALVAASRTIPENRIPHSLHAYFLRRGDMSRPIIYEVDRIRDGGSFTTRRVQAIQHGEPIFSVIVSFHISESGWDHQAQMPQVPPAEELRDGASLNREWLAGPRDTSPGLLGLLAVADLAGIEFRPVQSQVTAVGSVQPPRQELWFRSKAAVPDEPLVQACVLAYASDFSLLGTVKLPHGGYFGQTDVQIASLDHALWFHREFRTDDWLLYSMESTSAHAARGFVRGQIFDVQGHLVASVAQEGLVRPLKPPPTFSPKRD